MKWRPPWRRPRVHPEYLLSSDRTRLEEITGRSIGPAVPVLNPAARLAEFGSQAEFDRRFAAIVAAIVAGIPRREQPGRDL